MTLRNCCVASQNRAGLGARRSAGWSLSKARNDARRGFGRNPSGRDCFGALLRQRELQCRRIARPRFLALPQNSLPPQQLLSVMAGSL